MNFDPYQCNDTGAPVFADRYWRHSRDELVIGGLRDRIDHFSDTGNSQLERELTHSMIRSLEARNRGGRA